MNEIAGPATPNISATPSPYVNRCALSEAWFRSLYATRRQGPPSPPPIATNTVQPAPLARRADPVPDKSTELSTFARTAATNAPRRQPASAVAVAVRLRGNRAALAAPGAGGWRAAVARRMTCRFALLGGGSVDLLLQQRGRRLHVVAVANGTPNGAPSINEALLRARTALAAHGLRIEIDVREKGLK